MRRNSFISLALFFIVGTAACGPVKTPEGATTPPKVEDLPLIERSVLFGNPDKAQARVSPDGKWVSWLAPKDGVLNVWVAPASDLEKAKVVTHDTIRGIRNHMWAYNGKYILYQQDKGGDENWRIYAVNVATSKSRDLTPFDGVQARVEATSYQYPDEIVVGLNNRKPELHDLYRLNVTNGEMELIQKNDGYIGYDLDNDMKVRLAWKATADGGFDVLRLDDGKWVDFMKVSHEDTLSTGVIGFDHSNQWIYLKDTRNRNTAVLRKVELATGKSKLLAKNEKADLAGVLRHPTKKHVQMVSFYYDRKQDQILDKSISTDISLLRTISSGDLSINSRTVKDDKWIVTFEVDDGPIRYYLYDRKTRKAQFLFTNRKALEGKRLSSMHPVIIDSRDGKKLVSYLTLPADRDEDSDARPDEPLPMVLLVHGGPWARDYWGYHPMHQWLANRGYAVLSVNYRGSTGFGKDFVNASTHEWAGKMHDDLIDAVDWAIEKKITTADRVAIMGGSYGGYATLVGLTFTPEKFVCGVDIVGPSNLRTLLESIPAYWKPMLEVMAARVGDPRTEEGKKLLEERSPLNHVASIKRPLLIGQGANDPRVKQAESDRIVEAMKTQNIPVTYVLFPDEGHGFARPENRLAFYAVAEAFLAEHLGGRVQPIGDAFTGSSIQVPAGADQVDGLTEAMPKHKIDDVQ